MWGTQRDWIGWSGVPDQSWDTPWPSGDCAGEWWISYHIYMITPHTLCMSPSSEQLWTAPSEAAKVVASSLGEGEIQPAIAHHRQPHCTAWYLKKFSEPRSIEKVLSKVLIKSCCVSLQYVCKLDYWIFCLAKGCLDEWQINHSLQAISRRTSSLWPRQKVIPCEIGMWKPRAYSELRWSPWWTDSKHSLSSSPQEHDQMLYKIMWTVYNKKSTHHFFPKPLKPI